MELPGITILQDKVEITFTLDGKKTKTGHYRMSMVVSKKMEGESESFPVLTVQGFRIDRMLMSITSPANTYNRKDGGGQYSFTHLSREFESHILKYLRKNQSILDQIK